MASSVGSEEADWQQVKMKPKREKRCVQEKYINNLDSIVFHWSVESQHCLIAGSQSECRRVNITGESSPCNSHLSTAGLSTDQMLYGENSSEHFQSCFDGVLHREKPIFRKQTGCLAEREREKMKRCTEELHFLSLLSLRTGRETALDIWISANSLFSYEEQYRDQKSPLLPLISFLISSINFSGKVYRRRAQGIFIYLTCIW